MAALRRHVVSLPRILQRCSVSATVQRHLFSGEILGIDSFRRQRVLVSDRLGDVKGSFLNRMKTELSRENSPVYTEDIKTLLHIVEADEGLTVLVNMLKRHVTGSRGVEISRFAFGPPLLRLMYITKQDDMALRLFRDQTLSSMFSHVTSHLLIMDLLYERGRYEDVVDIYQSLRTTLGSNFRYPSDCTTLLLAALYRMNTEEALHQTIDILKEIKTAYMKVTARALAFSASLALSQDNPATALEICSSVHNPGTLAIQNLKMICYARLGRVEDTLPFFRHILHDDRPVSTYRSKVFTQTISAVEKASEMLDDVGIKQEVQSIRQALHSGGLIRDDSLTDFIEQPIHRSNQMRDGFKSRQRSHIDGARSRGPGYRPGYKKYQQGYGYQ